MEPPAGIVPATHCLPHVRNEILKEGALPALRAGRAAGGTRPGRRGPGRPLVAEAGFEPAFSAL